MAVRVFASRDQVLSKPQAHFAHQRTVCLIVDNDIQTIDVLKLAKSLPEYSGEIKGIVPLFGGKCFDITLASREAAAKLARRASTTNKYTNRFGF